MVLDCLLKFYVSFYFTFKFFIYLQFILVYTVSVLLYFVLFSPRRLPGCSNTIYENIYFSLYVPCSSYAIYTQIPHCFNYWRLKVSINIQKIQFLWIILLSPLVKRKGDCMISQGWLYDFLGQKPMTSIKVASFALLLLSAHSPTLHPTSFHC